MIPVDATTAGSQIARRWFGTQGKMTHDELLEQVSGPSRGTYRKSTASGQHRGNALVATAPRLVAGAVPSYMAA